MVNINIKMKSLRFKRHGFLVIKIRMYICVLCHNIKRYKRGYPDMGHVTKSDVLVFVFNYFIISHGFYACAVDVESKK